MLVVSAKYVAPLKVELHFSDGTVKTIDVGAFIRKHPQYNSFFPLDFKSAGTGRLLAVRGLFPVRRFDGFAIRR